MPQNSAKVGSGSVLILGSLCMREDKKEQLTNRMSVALYQIIRLKQNYIKKPISNLPYKNEKKLNQYEILPFKIFFKNYFPSRLNKR